MAKKQRRDFSVGPPLERVVTSPPATYVPLVALESETARSEPIDGENSYECLFTILPRIRNSQWSSGSFSYVDHGPQFRFRNNENKCFMNAALQMLFRLEPVVRICLDHHNAG